MKHRGVFLIIYLLFLLLISCSPQKRLESLVKRHPDLVQTIVKDTTFYDTTVIHGYTLDTVAVTNSIDTIVIENDSLLTTIYRHHDTITVRQVMKETVIVKPIEVQGKTKVIKVRYGIEWNRAIRWIVLAILAICAAIIASKANLKSLVGMK